MYDVLLIRYGEIGLKGKNRSFFENQLVKNIQGAVSDVYPARVKKIYGRLLVDFPAGGELEGSAVVERLQKVFGIVGISPALRVELNMDAIKEGALRLAEEAVRACRGGEAVGAEALTFKVETRRPYKAFPYQSLEISREVGAHLLSRLPNLKVNLHRPEVVVNIEVREAGVFLYWLEKPGPGGLPVGVSGRGMLLLSGGIDSPVAGWMAMKRGISVEAVHFYSFPFTGEKSKEKVIDLCRVLAGYGGQVVLHVVFFTEIQKSIQRSCPEELRVTIMRRMMFRLAQRLAGLRGALVLITGESVGQVASQTLESMAVIERVVDIPVLRPLVGFDKHEIIDLAGRIGTYDISVLPYEDCCTLFLPRRPSTRPNLERVLAAEEKLPLEELLEEALEKTEMLVVRRPER